MTPVQSFFDKICYFKSNVVILSAEILGHNVKVQINVFSYTGATRNDDIFLGKLQVFKNKVIPRDGTDQSGAHVRAH